MAVARARRRPGARANRGWERFVRVPYQYLPPAAGATGVGVGLGLLLRGAGDAASVAGLGLVLGSEVGVALWLGYLLWGRRRAAAPSRQRTPAPVPPVRNEREAGEAVAVSVPVPAPAPRRSLLRASAPDPVPHSGIGRAATSRFSWSGAEIWQRWRRAEAGHLGAELIAPVPETAYVAPHAGGLHPFAARDRDLWFEHPTIPLDRAGAFSGLPQRGALDATWGMGDPPPAPSVALPAHARFRGSHAGPFSPDDLDRLFPPDVGGPAGPSFLSSLPAVPPPEDEDSILAALEDLPLDRSFRSGAYVEVPRPGVREAGVDESIVAAPEELPLGPIPRPSAALGDRFPDALVETVSPEEESARSPSPSVTPAEPIAIHEFPPGDVTAPWSGGGMIPDAPSIDHLLYLEAINPVPPHLRGAAPAPPVAPSRPAPRPIGARSSASQSCTACTRGLGDFRSWAPCIGCGRPVCRECLHRSFVLGEEGFCWDCSRLPSS